MTLPLDIPFDLTAIEIERFLSRITRGDGCWEWRGHKLPDGYGLLPLRRNGKQRSVLAHRVAWTIANTEIPPGKIVLHACDNPSCVRPDHLSVGTYKDNAREAVERNRRNFVRPLKPTCKYGHILTDGTFYVNRSKRGSGWVRMCKICQAKRSSDWHKRKVNARKIMGDRSCTN